MTSRRSGLGPALRVGAFLLLAAPVGAATLLGCGGSMSSSAYGWQMTDLDLPTRIVADGDADVSVSAAYLVTVPNVNENFFQQPGGGQGGGTGGTGGQGQQIPTVGSFSTQWSEVPANGASPILQISNAIGNTSTTVDGSSFPDVRLLGSSAGSFRAVAPGSTTLRLRIVLHYSDGSTDQEDFLIPVTVSAPDALTAS